MAPPNVEFRYAARSDIGLKRSSNQDSGYAGHNLLVLADGMGGAAGGDIASSVAVAHLAPLGLESTRLTLCFLCYAKLSWMRTLNSWIVPHANLNSLALAPPALRFCDRE